MGRPIILKCQSAKGENLEAGFDADRGMNLFTFRKNGTEVIDQSTHADYLQTGCGLGPLIGPHYGSRHPEAIPPIKEESLQAHVEVMRKHGYEDPFFDGVARYAPWQTEQTDTTLKATLNGKNTLNNVPLAQLEGQAFQLLMDASLDAHGLHIDLSVVSDTDSVMGIDYRFALPHGKGTLTSDVAKIGLHEGKQTEISHALRIDEKHTLRLDLSQPAYWGFYPYLNPLKGNILLETETYALRTTYSCQSQENTWIVRRPEKHPYVSLCPLSAKNPWCPNLTVSSIHINLEIL